MTYSENLWLFSALLLGGILLPGADMIFVLGNSLSRGRDAGLAATMGLIVGGLAHSIYAALGVSLMANIVPALFKPMAAIGAIYMAWIGLSLIRSSIVVGGVAATREARNWATFRRGIVTCLLNPKAYLFMLAIYPQFLRPELGPLLPQAIAMAAILAVIQLIVYGGLAVTTSRAKQLTSNPTLTIWLGRVCGYCLLAISCLTMWSAIRGEPVV